MAQWGRNDTGVTANSTTTYESSNGAPMGTYALVKGSGGGTNPISMDSNAHFGNTSAGSRASVDFAMYGNTTIGAFIPNMAVGVFAVNAVAMNVTGGNVVIAYVTTPGSGYAQNTANFTPVVVNGGTGASLNAISNNTTNAGHITGFNIVVAGSGYITPPSLSNLPAPAAIQIGANSTYINSSANTILLSSANTIWQANDRFYYGVATGNTSIVGLVGNTYYYVSFANSTALAVSATQGGANLQLTANASSSEHAGHTIQGDTAAGYVDINAIFPAATHAGWVVRREGTGGRAGRVQYETLVAMGSLGVNTATSIGVVGNPDTVTANSIADPFI